MLTPLIVIIDEDVSVRALLDDVLHYEGYQTILCSTAQLGFACAVRTKPDLVVLDLWIDCPDAGWKLIHRLRDDARTSMIPILVCTSYLESLKTHEDELRYLGYRIVAKPFDIYSLIDQVRSLTPAFEHQAGECEHYTDPL